MDRQIIVYGEETVMRDALVAHLRNRGVACEGVSDPRQLMAVLVDRRPDAVVIDAWPGGEALDQMVITVRSLSASGVVVVVGTRFSPSHARALAAAGADVVVTHVDFPTLAVPVLVQPLHDQATYPALDRVRDPDP